MALTGRLVALAAAGVLLVAFSAWLALGYAALLAVLVICDVAAAARIADLRIARDPLPAVRLGEQTHTTLRLRNTGRRRLRGLLRDAWVPSAGARPRSQRIDVPAGERRALTNTLQPVRRGPRPAAAVTVRAVGPLGLAARQRSVPVGGVLRVLPAFTSRRFLPEKLARLRQIEGAVALRQRGQGSEFDSLRSYVIGDDVRSIDWRATARARDVMIRTWRPERDRTVVLALDTGRTAAARLEDAPRLDAALDASLLLAAVAARAGDRVGMVAADTEIRARLAPASGPALLRQLVAALYPVQPHLVETDPTLLAAAVLGQVGRRSLIVLFSALDTGTETGLLPAARVLALRHRLVVASVSDPTLTRLARQRADTAEVYTAATAELAAAGRELTAERLRRLGAYVVQAPAEVFASQVTDAYLNLKAEGRL